MKKTYFLAKYTSVLGGALLCVASLLFSSCENFLNGTDTRDEIIDTIAYNNAKEITVLVQPEEGTGSTVPSGNFKAKQGYDFEVSFSENPAYSFVRWIAVEKENPSKEVSAGVVFEDAEAPATKVKISDDSVAIRLIPYSMERIAVSGEPSPRYDPLGVSRDRSISVSFTKPLSPSCFIFQENEIPVEAQTRKDADGNIWSYSFDGQTYLKNISITNIDDYSIAEHFTKPTVEGKLLTIGVDKSNPIEFNSGEIYKTVKVTLSKDITDTSNIKMNSTKSWNYQITEATDEKATVNLSCVAAEGSVYLAGTKDYSIGQKITLSFTEDADYQFVKWEYDPAIIYIAEPLNSNTTATILEKTTGNDVTQIKAFCAPRLRVTSFSPVNDSTNPTVSKNSSISIQFNHDLPAVEADLEQLKNISITMGGNPVKSCFKAPSVTADTVTFAADNSNMVSVPAGQKKTISVTIPSDFYYKLEDGTIISYGANGITFDYKIDETTLDKAEVTFTAPSNSGEFTAEKGQNNQYSLGQEVEIAFKPNEGWKFNGWSVKCGSEEVPESKIKIADKNAVTTKLIVYEAIQGVTVTANAYLVPIVQSVKLNGTVDLFSVNSFNCYSSFHFKFNKKIDKSSLILSAYDSLTITKNGAPGIHYENYFTAIWKSDTELVITPDDTFKDFVRSENGQVSMTITLNANGQSIRDVEGNTLCPSEEVYNSFTINCLVSGSQEDNPPVITDIHLYSTSDPTAHYRRELSNLDFNSWTRDWSYPYGTYGWNNVSSVYITLSGYDSESGIKEVQVTETYMRDTSNSTPSIQQTSSTHSFRTVDSYSRNDDGNSVYNYAFIYDFDSENTTDDGLFKLEISLCDNDGNKTKKIYYVIKNTANNLQLDKMSIFTSNKLENLIPVYNNEKNCYEAGINFMNFSIPCEKFYTLYSSNKFYIGRYITLTMYEDGVNKGEIFSYDLQTGSLSSSTINNAISNVKRDITKNVILRMKIEQRNGIVSEIDLPLNKASYIAGLNKNGSYLYNKIGVTDMGDKDNVSLEISTTPSPTSKNDFGHDPDNDGEGIYYLFPIVTTRLGYKGSTGSYGFEDTKPIYISKPFAYYNGVTPPVDDSIQFPIMTLPDPSYEAGEITYEPNTGYASFDIDIDYPDNGYDYSQYRYVIRLDEIRDRNPNGDCFDITENSNIRVKTGTVRTVYLVALDSQGSECAKSEEQTLDLTLVDNQPPFIAGHGNYHASYNDIRNYRFFFNTWGWRNGVNDTRKGPYDIDSTLERVLNVSPINCYVVPKSYGVNLTKDQLEGGMFKKVSIPLADNYAVVNNYGNSSCISIPYDGLDFGEYYIYLYIEDSSPLKNSYLVASAYLLKNYIAEYVPEVTFETVESVDKIKISAPPYKRNLKRTTSFPDDNARSSDPDYLHQIHGNYVNIKKIENNSWTTTVEFDSPYYDRSTIARMKDENGNNSQYNGSVDDDSRYYYSVDYSDYENNFIQVIVNYTSTDWRDGVGYGKNDFEIVQSQPIYVYSDYLRYKGTANEIVCNNKNWIEGGNGYQIFCDAPVFIHTMYCSRNLNTVLEAEKYVTPTTEQYIREWESRAQESGIYTYTGNANTSFTYSNDNLKDIPSGNYYTTIVHFADGTTLMSDVKQKQ